MKLLVTIFLLLGSNVFMTLAWYGHLKFKEYDWSRSWGLGTIILVSWGLALFEYFLQVPANRIGSKEYGGPMDLFQLKILQEVISLFVFTAMALVMFKSDTLKWNHAAAMICMIGAVYFVFKK
ncbi:MAG: hypothetical protein RL106_1059 [Bacteroidota bacterium]|jgi:uncharacterized protein (DUF486 family)